MLDSRAQEAIGYCTPIPVNATPVPLVSILLPVFNAEKFLEKAVCSLLEQSFREFEIIAMDDGSTDGSVEILRRLSDPRIRIERNGRNLGLIETLNRGVSLCRGEFIARMDADDVAAPTRIEKQYNYLKANPQCILVGSGRIGIDDLDRPVSSFNRPATGSALIRWKLLTGNFITHPTVMLRKSVLPPQLFDDKYKHAEDYAAWLLLSSLGDIEILPEKLLQYRFHGQSVSHQNKMAQVRSAMKALADHLERLHGVAFEFNSLALWSAPQDAAHLEKSGDFFTLLRWMNPLRAPFRRDLRGAVLFKAFGHYHRRLALLLISHRRRIDLALPVVGAMLLSIFPGFRSGQVIR